MLLVSKQWGVTGQVDGLFSINYPIAFKNIFIFLRTNESSNTDSGSFRAFGFSSKSNTVAQVYTSKSYIKNINWVAIGS